MRQDRLHQVVEDFGLRCDPTRGVRVHVPGAELVQRGRLLVRQVQDVAVSRARGAVHDPLQDVGEVAGPSDGVILRTADRKIHGSLALARRGRNLLPSPRSRKEDRCHARSEEHTSELQSRRDLVCRLLLEKKKKKNKKSKREKKKKKKKKKIIKKTR